MRRIVVLSLVAFTAGCAGQTGVFGFPDATGRGDGGQIGQPDGGAPGGGNGVGSGGTADGGLPGGSSDGGTSASDGGTSASDGGVSASGGFVPLRHSPIADENALAGSSNWHLDNYSRQLGAYCDRTSYLPGESATLFAAAQTPAPATWELWRLGYYGGQGGRMVANGGPFQLQPWTAALLDPTTGAVRAGWSASTRIPIPSNAVTGVYVVKILTQAGGTYATLVVRDPGHDAAILYPVSTNTYQAYNPWGGTSLYENSRSDWSASHAFAVSFDRPYLRGTGTGELFGKDLEFVTFVEGQGYDIAYVTDADLDADPGLVLGRRMIAAQGHSEYWTAAMRDAYERAIAAGSNVAFFAANNAYWQVRFQDASRRTLIGYKEYASRDPAMQTDPAHVTTRWRDAPVSRPENAMIGEMFGSWVTTDTPLIVTQPDAWPWTGSGVAKNSMIAGAYGDEVDRRIDNGLQPAGVEAIASGFAEGYNHAALATGETTLYTAPSGAQVFSAGSISWSRALASPGKWDRRVQQLVANLFSRFGGDGRLGAAALKPLSLAPGAVAPNYRPGVQVTTVASGLPAPVAVAAAPGGDAIVAGGHQIWRVTRQGAVTLIAGSDAGYTDGPAATARFNNPHGVALGANGDVYVSDTNNHVIRVISNGQVRTLAGTGAQGFADGAPGTARFSQPMGIAMAPGGTLLVADMWNHRLRAVSAAGTVSTWAGNGSSGVSFGAGSGCNLMFPFAVTVLPSGDAALAEAGSGILLKVSAGSTHDVSQLAGVFAESGWDDGPVSGAGVSETLGLAARFDGQLIILDSATARVRALRNGVVDTLAGGTYGGTVDGPGASAGFGWPRAVAAAPDGAIFVVDAREHTLRLVTLN